jgi:O-antigen ligase
VTTALAPQRQAPARGGAGQEICIRLLMLYAFLLPVQVATPIGIRIALSDLAVIAYLAIRGGRLRRVVGAWTVWHHALVVVVWGGLLVALIRTGEVGWATVITKAAGLLVLLATFASLVDVARDWEALRRVLRAFLAGALLHGALAVLVFVLRRSAGIAVPWINVPYETSRMTGLLIDPNAFGGLLGIALLLHLCTAAHGRPLLRGRWTRVADVVLPLALLGTFSRSAWIGTLLGLAAVLIVDPYFAVRVVRRLLIPLSVGVLVGWSLLTGFSSLVARPQQVEDRLQIADAALEDFLEAPLLGTGLGVFGEEHGVIVHNTLLWFLTEMGLVGLAVFAGLLLTTAWRGYCTVGAAPPAESGLAVGLLAGFCVGLGLSVGIEATYQRPWWLVLAGLSCAYVMCRQDTRAPCGAPL